MCQIYVSFQDEQHRRVTLHFTDLSPKFVKDIKDFYAIGNAQLEAKDIVVLLNGEVLNTNEELIEQTQYVIWYNTNVVADE